FVTGLLAATALAACGGAPPIADRPPAAPEADDPAFRVERVPAWLLVGDALTPADDDLEVEVQAPDGVEVVDAFVGDLPGVRLERSGRLFRGTVDVAALAPGEYPILLAADGADVAFASRVVRRSH